MQKEKKLPLAIIWGNTVHLYLANSNWYFTEKFLWGSFNNPFYPRTSMTVTQGFLLQPTRTSSLLTMTKGISSMVSRKRRSWKLGQRTRKKTRPSGCLENSDMKKKTNFHSMFVGNWFKTSCLPCLLFCKVQ